MNPQPFPDSLMVGGIHTGLGGLPAPEKARGQVLHPYHLLKLVKNNNNKEKLSTTTQATASRTLMQ